ncbi:hypothetical protein HBZS_103920 [Helicobacter bizzozeronii CCUG 35545]|nr:hypothetical protein HBZS_103920 [Helicobacter bizzozeronii CCUG 35545]
MRIGLSWKFYGILASGLVFLGCAHTESRAQLAQFQQAYYAKQNPQADKLSKKFIDQDKKTKRCAFMGIAKWRECLYDEIL